MDADWNNLHWRLSTDANQGKVYAQDVTQIVFDVAK